MLKKIFIGLILLSVILYFGSSYGFSSLGENIVVPIMIITLAVGTISSIGLLKEQPTLYYYIIYFHIIQYKQRQKMT